MDGSLNLKRSKNLLSVDDNKLKDKLNIISAKTSTITNMLTLKVLNVIFIHFIMSKRECYFYLFFIQKKNN